MTRLKRRYILGTIASLLAASIAAVALRPGTEPIPDRFNAEVWRRQLDASAADFIASSPFGAISDAPLDVTPALMDHTSPEAAFAREYFFQLGVVRPVRDADMIAIFDLLDRFSRGAIRRAASSELFDCLSEGRPYELLASQASPAVREQCLVRILEVLGDTNNPLHEQFLLDVGTVSLWRYPEIRQAIESLRDYVYQDRAVMHHFQYMLAEMDAVPPDAIDPDPYLIEFERKQQAKPKGD